MNNYKKEIAIKIGGPAGFGIKSSGLILAESFFRAGLSVFGYSEYPSLIRGGHNSYQINAGENNINSASINIDVLIALNQESIELHESELNPASIIIHDGLVIEKNIKASSLNIPLKKLASNSGNELSKNTVAIGAAAFLAQLNLEKINEQIKKIFGDKGKKIVDINKKAAKYGYEHASKAGVELKKIKLGYQPENNKGKNNLFITSNHATALGAIQAGCKLYSAYPMTPASSIMHILAAKQKKYDMVVHQTEDEISAIGVAIGAATTGVRAATGTSGGGFALMTENLGLAAITETPLVIIESQRTAPATGLPTWTEQGDLQFVIRASHGEFPRIVIAPGDAEEAFYMIQNAFNLAEKFQVPVIFLMDKMISESDFSCFKLDYKAVQIKREEFLSENELERGGEYKRYRITKTGISKRVLPGQKGGVHLINSDDHDEYGFSTEDSKQRINMMDKRFKKIPLIEADIPEPILYGPKQADLTIVGWGSVKGAVLDAIEQIRNSNQDSKKSINFVHLTYLWPFPAKRMKAILKRASKIMLVENNKTGQLGDLIRQETGFKIKHKFLKYDGRPFFREEIIDKIKEIFKNY